MEKAANTIQKTSWIERAKATARNPQFWGFFASIAILFIVSMMFFYPDASQGNELRQHDMIQGAANGQEAKAWEEATGETTRWTNSLFSGMPTFQISPSYPSNGMFDWINGLYGLGLPSPSNILFMMMFGFLILMFAMKVKWYYAVIGAIAYGFSSYFIILIGAGHIWKFVTLAYIPPTIAGIWLCYKGKFLIGGAIAALFGMMQIASNHIQMSYYFGFVIIGLAIAFLCVSIKEKTMPQWIKATAALALAGILAIAANSPSLYNTYEYSKETMRGGHSEIVNPDKTDSTDGLDRSYITAYSYGTSELYTLFIPNVRGGGTIKPEQGKNKFLSLADVPEIKESIAYGTIDETTAYYLSQIPQYFDGPEMTNGPVYVGAIIFALFIMGCIIVRGPVKWVLLTLTLLSMLLALGRNFQPLTDLFIDYIPMYSKFRTVESILVIAEFTIPVLAILGLQKFLTKQSILNKIGFYCGFGLTGAICLIGGLAPDMFGDVVTAEEISVYNSVDSYLTTMVIDIRHGIIASDCWRSFWFIFFASVPLTIYMAVKPKSQAAKTMIIVSAIVVGVLVTADLYSVNKRYVNSDSFCKMEYSTDNPLAPNQIDNKILQDTDPNYRVMSIPEFSSPRPSYHHKMIGGYHAAKLTRYQDLIDHQISKNNIEVLNMLNTKYIITNDWDIIPNPEAYGNAWLINRIDYVDNANEEMAALDSINRNFAVADKKFEQILGQSAPISNGDDIYATSYAPNKLTYNVNTQNGGIAVFSEVYFPWGWNATIDGEEVEIGRVNYVLRAIRVPAGSHEIVMTFDPQSIHTTTTVATIAVILIYLSIVGAIALALAKLPAVPNKQD